MARGAATRPLLPPRWRGGPCGAYSGAVHSIRARGGLTALTTFTRPMPLGSGEVLAGRRRGARWSCSERPSLARSKRSIRSGSVALYIAGRLGLKVRQRGATHPGGVAAARATATPFLRRRSIVRSSRAPASSGSGGRPTRRSRATPPLTSGFHFSAKVFQVPLIRARGRAWWEASCGAASGLGVQRSSTTLIALRRAAAARNGSTDGGRLEAIGASAR